MSGERFYGDYLVAPLRNGFQGTTNGGGSEFAESLK